MTNIADAADRRALAPPPPPPSGTSAPKKAKRTKEARGPSRPACAHTWRGSVV
jgi:hypothetical protein